MPEYLAYEAFLAKSRAHSKTMDIYLAKTDGGIKL